MHTAKLWQLGMALLILLGVIGLIVYTWPDTSVEPLPHENTLEAARALAEAGHLAEAREMVKQMLLRDPEGGGAYFLLGWICLRQEDAPCAEAAFLKALELEPERAAAINHNLGVLAFSQGKADKALQYFLEALEADPDDLDTRYQAGAAYLVLALPENTMLVDTQKLDLAVEQFERVLQADPDKVEALVGLGNAHLIVGRYDQALPLLERAVAIDPIPEALFALGRAYAMVGRAADARAMLQRFLDTNPPALWAEEARALLGQLEP